MKTVTFNVSLRIKVDMPDEISSLDIWDNWDILDNGQFILDTQNLKLKSTDPELIEQFVVNVSKHP